MLHCFKKKSKRLYVFLQIDDTLVFFFLSFGFISAALKKKQYKVKHEYLYEKAEDISKQHISLTPTLIQNSKNR